MSKVCHIEHQKYGKRNGTVVRVYKFLSAHRHIPTSTTTTASIVAGGHFHQLQPDAELLAHPNVQLPVWVNSDLASNQGYQGPPIGKTSYLTTTELLLRAQALLAKDVHPAELRRPRRRSRQHSPTLSYRSDSSQSSHFSCDREQQDRREERQKRHRQRYRTTNDDVVRFKVGSATPEKETVAANVDGVDLDDDDDGDDDEQLVERLREMDVSDLVEQRDVLTRQIATSLVTLHHLNQELDRRRRRKSYSTFRKKDVASAAATSTTMATTQSTQQQQLMPLQAGKNDKLISFPFEKV